MTNRTKKMVEDWQAVREKIASFDWARGIVDGFKPDTDWWVANYADDASRVAGWGHHYFCDKCFAALIFDPGKPGEHRCSGCGELRIAQEADDAWCYIYRTSACTQVFHAAVLYNLYGDPAYLSFIGKVLGFLCDHYGSFEVRTPPGQEGKFTGCDLTDGVAVIWLLNGMELVKGSFTDEEMEHYKQTFFIPEAAFLIEKVGGYAQHHLLDESGGGHDRPVFRRNDLVRTGRRRRARHQAQAGGGPAAGGFLVRSFLPLPFLLRRRNDLLPRVLQIVRLRLPDPRGRAAADVPVPGQVRLRERRISESERRLAAAAVRQLRPPIRVDPRRAG
ncbi:hypothetical protein [Cohnella rhizosphaerae]|uniref:Uncharacterized protein n=1 Tax=Cohnella rhizosphaerae TaxID=1457232 RepID=A0A9X4KUZ3_9BACL|nr:hypothetical protein [Cohnella rhizosphaerae]MDG0811609.1 hypothetical protein [Cohnella rhizosphaerae]